MKSWHIESAAEFTTAFSLGALFVLAHDYSLHSIFGYLAGAMVIAGAIMLFHGLMTQTPPKGAISHSLGGLGGVLVAFGSVQQGWMVAFILFLIGTMLVSGLYLWLNAEANQDLVVKENLGDE